MSAPWQQALAAPASQDDFVFEPELQVLQESVVVDQAFVQVETAMPGLPVASVGVPEE